MSKKKRFTIIIILIICALLIIIFKNYIWNGLTEYNNSKFRNLLEIFYFIATPVLLIVAIFGLKQISVSKENSRISSLRDSYKLASQQCSYFLNNIIPLYNKVNDLLETKSITALNKKEISVSNKTININSKKMFNEKEKITSILPEIVDVLNATEAFSVYIISGVADEKIAFNSIGHTYCTCVCKLLPIIVLAQQRNCYKNILKLFILWHNKENKQNLLSDKNRIEKDLQKISSFSIKGIGV